MKTVPLSGKKAAGRVALVDDEDYELVMQYRWCVSEQPRARGPAAPYAVTNIRISPKLEVLISMHRLIVGRAGVDHANRNSLDNRRSNLRPATARENLLNQASQPGAHSRYKGVDWHKTGKCWRARIRPRPGVRLNLGLFRSEEDAARAYDAAARKHHGEFAYLNFPDT